jgi:predicted DNA-binding helix-hairpin-helix protein
MVDLASTQGNESPFSDARKQAQRTRKSSIPPSRTLDPQVLRRLIVPGAGGRRVFRILLKNACRFACGDCPMRAQSELGPELLEPARIARLFLVAYRRGWCDGVFITSGVARSSVWATEQTLELVESLRVTLGFRGYIHVKTVEGAEPGQIERLLRLVDRVSHHPEPRCAEEADATAPGFREPRESAVPDSHTLRRSHVLPPRSSAAFGSWRRRSGFVGADRNRTNQAEKLLRDDGLIGRELGFRKEGGFPVGDPKLEWAASHPERFPLEVTSASREELQRVPGLGPRSVEWILAARAHGRLSSPDDLDVLGPAASRAAGFLLFRGRPIRMRTVQPTLFEQFGASSRAAQAS